MYLAGSGLLITGVSTAIGAVYIAVLTPAHFVVMRELANKTIF